MFGTLNGFLDWLMKDADVESLIFSLLAGGFIFGVLGGGGVIALGMFLGFLLWLGACALLVKIVRPWVEKRAHDEAVSFYETLLEEWNRELIFFKHARPKAVTRRQLLRSLKAAKGNKELTIAALKELVHTTMAEENFGADLGSFGKMFADAKKLVDRAHLIPAENAAWRTSAEADAATVLAIG